MHAFLGSHTRTSHPFPYLSFPHTSHLYHACFNYIPTIRYCDCRWTKKVNLFSLDKILFPINDDNVHWFLAVIDLRVITYMIVT